jgi:hypothetical protein
MLEVNARTLQCDAIIPNYLKPKTTPKLHGPSLPTPIFINRKRNLQRAIIRPLNLVFSRHLRSWHK